MNTPMSAKVPVTNSTSIKVWPQLMQTAMLSADRIDDAQLLERRSKPLNRQSHYVAVATLDSFDDVAMLNGVCPRPAQKTMGFLPAF